MCSASHSLNAKRGREFLLPDLTMRTARPTTRSPLSVSEVGTAPFDPVSSCFRLLGRLDPANPFISGERAMSSHVANALASEVSAFFKSAGRVWTTPPEIAFLLKASLQLVAPAKSNITSQHCAHRPTPPHEPAPDSFWLKLLNGEKRALGSRTPSSRQSLRHACACQPMARID